MAQFTKLRTEQVEAGGSGPLALDDLTDVDASSPSDGDGLFFDDVSGTWKNEPPPTGGTPDASDVTYTPAVNADWDGDTDPGNADDALDQLAERVDDLENMGGSGDMTYAVIQACQLVNEIKGWPPIVNTGDLDALNLWWDKVGTPTTAPTVADASGEGLTDNYELCMKVIADAASEGLSQRWTFANEPRVKAGRVLSALVAIWSVSSVSVTAKLVNSDASHTDATAVTAAAWTVVEIPNHTLAGTYCDLQITAGTAGTFYVVPLGVNIGARAFPLRPRGLRYVEIDTNTIVSNVDPGGNWTDVDLTSIASPNAVMACLNCVYKSNTSNDELTVRRNGAANQIVYVCRATSTGVYYDGWGIVDLDDGNIFEYVGGIAAHVEEVYIRVTGFWEWE